MRILDKYIIKNFLRPLLYCLSAFIILFVIGDLFEHLSNFLKIPHWPCVILKYYVLFIPSICIYIFPVAILLALLYSLGKMQRHNEISAMRAGGVGIYRISAPLLILCLMLSGLVFYINETVVPRTLQQSELLKQKQFTAKKFREILRDVTYHNPITRRSFYFKTFDTSTNMATKALIYELKPNGQAEKRISAREAAWLDGHWWLFDGLIYTFPEEGPPEKKNLLKQPFRFQVNPGDLQESQKELAALSYSQLKRFLARKKGFPISTLRPALVELHQKISFPLACAIMGLIGVAFGLKLGRGGMLAGVGICLFLGFLYYVLYSVSVALGKQGYIAPWLAAWSGNIIFSVTGLVMIRRMV